VAAEQAPVTVVMAAYNREDLVGRAIRSVLAQEPIAPAEILVVDDGSSDRTADVAESLGARVVRHGVNRGESHARNTAIEAAANPWIAVLDSDDEWLPGHLTALWRAREDHVVVATSALRCGEDPARDRLHGAPGTGPRVIRTPSDLLFPENAVTTSALMLRRDVAQAAGGFDQSLRLCEDLDLLLRCLEHGTGVVAPEVTAVYHMHDGQLSNERREMRMWHTRVATRYTDRAWWSERQFERWQASLAWDDFRAGMGLKAALPALRRPISLARLLHWRLQVRRRGSRLSRDGGPSVALMPGASDAGVREGARVVDLRARSRAGALVELLKRPAGVAVPGSRLDRLLLPIVRVPVS
jgi:glycosyltransferase involved in cell wall biosynthesis